MNRENKFRAWIAVDRKMVFNFRINSITGKFSFQKNSGLHEDADFPVMQFTGLKDKNGKEIYEGDIIFVDDEKWIVSFDCGTFGLKYNPDDKLTPLFQYNPKELLIAGNIFENPKLLK